jgi:hypothetical protein
VPWARSFCPFRAYWVISSVQFGKDSETIQKGFGNNPERIRKQSGKDSETIRKGFGKGFEKNNHKNDNPDSPRRRRVGILFI